MHSPSRLARGIRRALLVSDDLRKAQWRGHPNPYAGHCYIAVEAVYHLSGGKEAGLKPMQLDMDGVSHWYLMSPEGIIDPTADQFSDPVPYEKGRGRGFLTRKPSKRARELMERYRAQRSKSNKDHS